MDEKNGLNLEVIENTREMRSNEVSGQMRSARQTNPIVRKLMRFGKSDSRCRFSVKDLFLR